MTMNWKRLNSWHISMYSLPRHSLLRNWRKSHKTLGYQALGRNVWPHTSPTQNRTEQRRFGNNLGRGVDFLAVLAEGMISSNTRWVTDLHIHVVNLRLSISPHWPAYDLQMTTEFILPWYRAIPDKLLVALFKPVFTTACHWILS
jgi:hypothetical protein